MIDVFRASILSMVSYFIFAFIGTMNSVIPAAHYFFLFLLVLHIPNSEAEDSHEVFLPVAMNMVPSSTNHVHSCKMSFALKSFAPLSEEQYEKDRLQRKTDLLEIMANLSDDEALNRIDTIEQAILQNSKAPRHIKGDFQFASLKNGNVFSLFNITYKSVQEEKWGMPVVVLNICSANSICHVGYDMDNRLAQISSHVGSVGQLDRIGRLNVGSVYEAIQKCLVDSKTLPSIESLQDVVSQFDCKRVGEYRYDDGAMATEIEVRKGGKLVQRICIDSNRGYVCPWIEVYADDGKVITEHTAKNFILHEATGLWFPLHFSEKIFDSTTGNLIKNDEYEIDQASLQLNPTLSEKVFGVDIPSNTRIMDARTKDVVPYIAVESGVLGPKNGMLNLAAEKWLVKEDALHSFTPSTGGATGWTRLLIFVTWLILLILAWRLLCRKGSPMLIIALLLPSCLGCAQEARQQDGISTIPAILDFGHVHVSSSPLNMSFDILNNSTEPLKIEGIISGCGCTIVKIPQAAIPPGEKVTASVNVNLQGKTGEFSNRILVQTSQQDYGLDICGIVSSDIWYNGQALRCEVPAEDQSLSTVFTLYTVEYPDMTFDWKKNNQNIEITEIARKTYEGETEIKLCAKMSVVSDNMEAKIYVTPTDEKLPSFSIPFYCYRMEPKNLDVYY